MPLRINNELNDLLPAGVTIEDLLTQDTRDVEDLEYVFKTQADERVRPEHAALHNTVWDANDVHAPIPPLGFNCRCYIEYRAKNKKAAQATGLEVVPKNPPEPGKEALDGFFDDAKQSSASADPGAPVTPVDTFGPRIGKEIEDKNITTDDAFDPETGDILPAAEVKNIADAKENNTTKRAVIASVAILQGFAITTSTQQRIVKLAQEILIEKPTLKDEQALFDAILKLRPGSVISLSPAQTRRNARRVAKQIRRSNGPLNGNS